MKFDLDIYKAIINEIHETLGRIVGIHVLQLVVEHAYWKTGQKYNETKLILFSEAGISLEPLEELEPERRPAAAGCGTVYPAPPGLRPPDQSGSLHVVKN